MAAHSQLSSKSVPTFSRRCIERTHFHGPQLLTLAWLALRQVIFAPSSICSLPSRWLRKKHLTKKILQCPYIVQGYKLVLSHIVLQIKGSICFLADMDLQISRLLLSKLIVPASRVNSACRQELSLALRKSMFSRKVDSRKMALAGYLALLDHEDCAILEGSSSQSASAATSNQACEKAN